MGTGETGLLTMRNTFSQACWNASSLARIRARFVFLCAGSCASAMCVVCWVLGVYVCTRAARRIAAILAFVAMIRK